MKISLVNNKPYYTKTQSVNNKQSAPLNFTGYWWKDVFVSSVHTPEPKIIERFHNFTVSEYSKLTPKEIKTLNIMYNENVNVYTYKIFEKTHDISASFIRAVLDRSFGKSNYEFLPIGRSLSSIGKVLGYKIGENNVKNIPMSNAHRFMKSDNLREAYKKGDIDIFAEYLNSIGLSKEEILSSGKTYILTDYCISGNSLKGAKNLFDFVFDSQTSKNILPIDISKIFSLVHDSYPNYYDFLSTINKHLFESRYKNLSTVDSCHALSSTAGAIKDLSTDVFDRKLLRFKLLDNEMSNPEHKHCSIKIKGVIKRD